MANPPNVILMVFDTLRPDFLSCYGKESSRITPAFDSVARDGILFENAFTVGRNTPISHGAMFTGKYPSESGLVGGFEPIPEDVPTLAEVLKSHGYETFAVSRRSGRFGSEFGYDRGFDEFFEPDKANINVDVSLGYFRNAFTNSKCFRDLLRTLRYGPDKSTHLKFELFLERITRAESPFFGFINQITTHGEYRAPRPYIEHCIPTFNRPKWYLIEHLMEIFGLDFSSINHPNVEDKDILYGAGKGNLYEAGTETPSGEKWLSKNEISIMRELYGAQVDYLDRQFHLFLNAFSALDEYEDTILILTSDHGEHLGEHGLVGHNHFLFDEVLNVPLIIAGPDVPIGANRDDLVSLIDIFDTVCHLTNVPKQEQTCGQSMFEPEPRQSVYAEYGIRDIDKMGYTDAEPDVKKELEAGRKCIRTQDHKLVLDSNGSKLLYNLPDENISDYRDPDITEDLYLRLIDTLTGDFKKKLEYDQVEVSGRTLKNLKELGYID